MEISDIVEAINGRDKGSLFFILSMEGDYLFLVNGKGRAIERPKKKKKRHVRLIAKDSSEAAKKIRGGLKVQNSEVRRALAAFIAANDRNEGGL